MIKYNDMKTADLVTAHNEMATELGKKTIKKFRDRKTAIARCQALSDELDSQPVPGSEPAVKNPRGRPAANRGKALFTTTDENPRFPGSFGYHSWNIIKNAPGILYEDYLKAGGRNNDLRWDLAHEFVRAELADDLTWGE